MKRELIVLVGCALAACCASEGPMVATTRIRVIEDEYVAAKDDELRYLARAACQEVIVIYPCAYSSVAFEMRRADYDASAAIIAMEDTRTEKSVQEAQRKTDRLRALVNGQ